MQADKKRIRPKQQWLWYQRAAFLWVLGAVLVIMAFSVLPPAGTKLGALGWAGVSLYILASAVPMVVLTMDRRRPQIAGTSAALAFFGVLGMVFYRYSGARWDVLGMMFFNKELLFEVWPILLGGLKNSILLFLVAAFLSVTVAPIVAVIRTLNNPIFNFVIDAFVDVFRSMPILVLVIFIYYALPFMEIHSSPFVAGVWGLFLSALAFMIEYFRAGIESVSRGHVEAARSLGLGVVQTMRFVVLPLAIRVVLPPLTGHLVGLLKATAFVSVVGMPELLKRAMEIVEWKANPTPLVTITIMYLLLLLPLMYGSTRLERRLARWTKPHRA
ncbi:MAG: amino acid ABC transporter permease [Mailhella sp.]|nr:amino acid ABC transporter permease [Mailhella sp.]